MPLVSISAPIGRRASQSDYLHRYVHPLGVIYGGSPARCPLKNHIFGNNTIVLNGDILRSGVVPLGNGVVSSQNDVELLGGKEVHDGFHEGVVLFGTNIGAPAAKCRGRKQGART